MTNLKELVEGAGKIARTVLVEDQDKELLPIFHLVAPDNNKEEDIIMGTPWRNEKEKLLAVAHVKKLSRELGAVAALFMSEMWLVERGPGFDMRGMDPPSEQPDRIEAVLAIAVDNEGNTEVGRWDIIRNHPGGSVIALVKQDNRAGDFSGRILDGLVQQKARSVH